MGFEDILLEVPEYREFMTVDELNESSRRLAEGYPGLVDLFQIGCSKAGEPIYALRVGDGDFKAIFIGFPHPNEPIGSLTIEFLSRKLAEDDDFRRKLNFTCYFIKVADVDGVRLNEGWFKLKYDTVTHMLNFYRTPGYKQVEWTFPVNYKTLNWSKPAPETRAIMNLIDRVKPDFLYSLHNSAFRGAYFYVSEPCPELYPKLQSLVKSQRLPLHLGEPEAPYMKKLADGVFLLSSIEKIYDFYEKHSDRDPASIINHGASSVDYVRSVSDAFSIICEMPYIFDEKVNDNTPVSITRREAVLRSIEFSDRVFNLVNDAFNRLEVFLDDESPFYEVVLEYLKRYKPSIEAKRRWAETDKSLDRPATVAELFDNLVITKYYRLRLIGQFIRLIDDSVKRNPSLGKRLEADRRLMLKELYRLSSEIDEEADIKVIPIGKLVRVQVGAALYAMDYVKAR